MNATTTTTASCVSTTVPYAKLILAETNVRKSNGAIGIQALAASIAEHGLIQPLVVTAATPKKTRYQVHAGGRRWRAIGALIEAGTLPKDYPVEVRIFANEDLAAREISLAENLQREAMTPADECTAYRDIVASGATAEDVARRFGVTVRHVHGRLRLADLAEPIFAALAANEITLDVAMAFGSVSDRDRQLATWERTRNTWAAENPQAIRRMLAEETLAASDPIAKFVGEAEYLAAGGRIERDLFAEEGAGTWTDGALARELATKKLTFEAEVAQLATKLGWVKPLLATNITYDDSRDLNAYYPPFADPTPEAQARMAEIEVRLGELEDLEQEADDEEAAEAIYAEQETLSAEYDKLRETTPIIPDDEREHVGQFLVLGGDGVPVLASRYYSTATLRKKPAATVGGNGVDTSDEETSSDDALPRSLEEQLAKDRRDILALHIAHDPALALDLAIFNLARDHAGHYGYNNTGCAVMIGSTNDPAGLKDIPHSHAEAGLEDLRSALPGDWAQEGDSFTSFLAFRALDDDNRAAWLAYAVSQSLKASLASGGFENAFQTRLGALIGIDPAQHWRPGAERFFDRLKKSQILGVLGQIDPDMPARYATAKKGELASAATRLCNGEAIVEPAIKERAVNWTPPQLAFQPAAAAEPLDNIDADGETADGHGDETLEDAQDDSDTDELNHDPGILAMVESVMAERDEASVEPAA